MELFLLGRVKVHLETSRCLSSMYLSLESILCYSVLCYALSMCMWLFWSPSNNHLETNADSFEMFVQKLNMFLKIATCQWIIDAMQHKIWPLSAFYLCVVANSFCVLRKLGQHSLNRSDRQLQNPRAINASGYDVTL